jgi:hypothetical protein
MMNVRKNQIENTHKIVQELPTVLPVVETSPNTVQDVRVPGNGINNKLIKTELQ